MHRAYIGLGSNLDNPIYQIKKALQTLKTLPKTQLETQSSLYRSVPLGPQDQPDYINAVAILRTQLTPETLLSQLQELEKQQGRVRTTQRWGPRTLDLDMLLYDRVQSKHPSLTLPHPALQNRAFVLYPLYECEPTLVLPKGKPLHRLITRCFAYGLRKLNTC